MSIRIPTWTIVFATALVTLVVWAWVGRDVAQWLGLLGGACAAAKKAGDVHQSEPTTPADDADASTDEVAASEETPSDEQLVDDLNELTEDVHAD